MRLITQIPTLGRTALKTTRSGVALGQECAKGTGDGNDQFGFGVIDGFPLTDMSAALGSVTPKFVYGLVERRGQVEHSHELTQCRIGLTSYLARGQ